MKNYTRKNRRFQLKTKFNWTGMAKTNFRHQPKRAKVEAYMFNSDTMEEYEGSTVHPKKVLPVCKLW